MIGLLRFIVLVLIGTIYFMYLVIKTINSMVGNAFLKLPRITRVSIVYTIIFCMFITCYVAKNTPLINEVITPSHYFKIEQKKIEVVYAETKPKPKVKKPKIITPQQTITASTNDYQKYAHDLCINTYGWTEADFSNLVKLWTRESSWRANAHNPSSGAHGIPQSLPASKMASEGADYYTNGYTQIRWGLKYIKNRYGNPSNAWAHSEQHGWY